MKYLILMKYLLETSCHAMRLIRGDLPTCACTFVIYTVYQACAWYMHLEPALFMVRWQIMENISKLRISGVLVGERTTSCLRCAGLFVASTESTRGTRRRYCAGRGAGSTNSATDELHLRFELRTAMFSVE